RRRAAHAGHSFQELERRRPRLPRARQGGFGTVASLKAKFKELGEGQSALGFDPLGGEQPMLAHVPISAIEPDPDQPRKAIGDLAELKASITRHGILQPVILSIVGDELYRLIAGERRFTAAKELGLETVPAIIRTIEEHNRLEVQLV